MHATFLALNALDLVRERSIEAERRARLLRGAGPMPPTLPRRILERLAAWIHPAAGRERVGAGASA